MKKSTHNIRDDKTYQLISFAFALLLILGLIMSLFQIQQKNNIRSRGDSPVVVNCSVDSNAMEISFNERELFDLINEHRKDNGLESLAWSDSLIRAASWMSNDMLNGNYLDHKDSVGRYEEKRITDCGYVNYFKIGEIVDSGTPDSKATFDSWKHSPAHNANMLNKNYKEAGIALAVNVQNKSYFWTFDLGTKIFPTPTITASPTQTHPSSTPIITPSGTLTITPSISISKTPTPTKTITPAVSVSPTLKVTPSPTPITIFPTLRTLDPNPAYSNSIITVIGTGGQKKFWDGLIDESNRRFKLYLDGQNKSDIVCYVNLCKGDIPLQGAAVGDHTISVDGGSKLTLKVIKPVPTGIPTPTITPIPTIPPDYIPNPRDMQLFVSAKIVGIGKDGNLNPKHQTRHVTVGIYDMENEIITEGNGFIIYDKTDLFRGVIHFGPIDNGIYFVKIISDNMLGQIVQPTFQMLDNNRLNILPTVTLLQGDINKDNLIDITDYNTALACFQDKRCEDKQLIDYNDDNTANIYDYNILLHNFWETHGD